MKLTKKDIQKLHPEKEFQRSYIKLFSIRTFYRNAIIKENYTIPTQIGDFIILSSSGQNLFDKLKADRFRDIEDYKIKYSILLEFYHDELFIDIAKSNSDELLKLLSSQILNGEITYPWIYGKLLYDKYFEEFDSHDDELNNQEVFKLLQDTPKGVFQLSNIIVGPFGVIETENTRYLPATKNIRLWHCTDPSCTSFHTVQFNDGQTILIDLENEIRKIISTEKESEWASFYYDIIESDSYYYDIDRLTECHLLLINAFGNNELKELLKDLIDTDRTLRTKFPNIRKLKGSPNSIVDSLDKAECFQLLLLVEDKIIITSLEKLIENKTIIIPSTEIRTSRLNLSGGFYDIYHQCNKLGVRSISALSNRCVVRLVNFIEVVYSDEPSRRDLEYRLMKYKKDSFKETIENYVLHEEPHKIVREALLFGLSQTEKSISKLYGNFQIPNNEIEKDYLVNKFLWKLGFDINIYPQTLNNFLEKLSSLKAVTQKSSDDFDENEKESIRSVAVNLFVLLEEVLEHTLSFITWTLLSDHYLKTKFRYNFEEARDFMCQQLNGHVIGTNEPLRFDNTGNNTLFPLTEGFVALMEICDKYISEGKEKYKRNEDEMPHFHLATDLITFPFLSKLLLFDIKFNQYEEVKAILIEFQREFSRSNVLSVRNRLEHKERPKNNVDGFPKKDEIIIACTCIETIFKKIIDKGIYPNIFLFKNSKTDKYNRKLYELEDYAGKVILIKPIPQFLGNNLPGYTKPQVISSIFTVGNSTEPLRFRHQESSEYLRFWKNFPRKKTKTKEVIEHVKNDIQESLTALTEAVEITT